MNEAIINPLRQSFQDRLAAEDRDGCVQFALRCLKEGQCTLPELYEGIIGPALSQSEVCDIGDDGCIWHEHVKTSIVRTVIECCWPAVAELQRKTEIQPGSVLVLCPEKEYHEIGARMVSDFFAACGWNTVFVGANTPREQFRAAVLMVKPAIVAVSVTDFYNLVETGKAIQKLRTVLTDHHLDGTRIFVGGHAFALNPDMARQIGADGILRTFSDIRALSAAKGVGA